MSRVARQRASDRAAASFHPAGGDCARFFLLMRAPYPSVRLARHSLRRWLEQRGVDPQDTADIVLACSEVCANAVEHPGRSARHAYEVDAECRGRQLTLTIRDFGRWQEPDPSAWRGRGLGMIGRLMDTVDVVPADDGTRVVMRKALRQALS